MVGPNVIFPPPAYIRGYLMWIGGPMFSGKSGELIRQMRRWRIAGKRCVLLRSAKVEHGKTQSQMRSRDALEEPCIYVDTLKPWTREKPVSAHDVFAVDEAQFFDDLEDSVREWLTRGKIVLTAGLDATFDARPFGQYVNLVPLATEVLKLTAVCHRCGNHDAAFSKRLTNNTETVDTNEHDYEARCYRCYAL